MHILQKPLRVEVGGIMVEREIGIKSLTIKVGAREICLEIQEARKLKEALEDLFRKEVIREVVIEHHREPYWRWDGPVWVSSGTGQYKFKAPWGQVLCSSSGHLDMEVK